jgi:hypothetical protein
MAFEITDLLIQVVTGSPHAKKGPASHCQDAVTCKAKPAPPTHCADTVTCVGVKPTHCQKVTCQPDKQTSAEAELDALLEQLRATLAETATV